MKNALLIVVLTGFLAACAAGTHEVWHPPAPDGQQQIDRYSTSSSGNGASPMVTTASVWVCRTRTSGPCRVVYTASFGGKSVVGQVIDGVGTIVTPIAAAKIIGNAMERQSDSTVVNADANATGGNATNTNTNTATGGAGGTGNATANPTVTGPTTTINNTVTGGTTTPSGPL